MSFEMAKIAGFQADLDAFVHAPDPPFKPEAADLGRYALVSWVRNGLAAAISEAPQEAAARAVIRASFRLEADKAELEPQPDPVTVEKLLPLRGPGDVVGIHAAQVIRSFPPHGATLTDGGVLAIVEFDRPDLPWLHSPFPIKDGRLAPWLALIVCPKDSATFQAGSAGHPERVELPVEELQPLDDCWAWAHAQVLGTTDGDATVATRLSDGYASQNLSRLICPRRLGQEGEYVACVVPTFEAGAFAGLNKEGGGLAWAWNQGASDATVTLPVYHRWSFSVGAMSNFETLARRMVSLPAPYAIGRRIVDMRAPGGGIAPDLTGQGGIQVVEGALHSPAKPPAGTPAPAEWSPARTAMLRDALEARSEDPALPRVGARLYARFQRGRNGFPNPLPAVSVKSDWFTALNLRPADRIAAGVGTRVVVADQERLMEAAWAQVGEVERANAALARLQFSRFVAEALIAKTLAKVDLGPLTAMTHPVHAKVPMPGEGLKTVYAAVQASSLPMAAAGAAFRRALVAGPVAKAMMKGTAAAQQHAPGNIVAQAGGIRDMRRTYAEPAATQAITQAGLATLDQVALGTALGVGAEVALTTAARRFSDAAPTMRRLSMPAANWRISRVSAVASRAAERLTKLEAELAAPSRDLMKREAAGAAIVRVMRSDPSLVARGARVLERLDAQIGPPPLPRRGAPTRFRSATDRFGSFGKAGRFDRAEPISSNLDLAAGIATIVGGIGVGRLPKTPPSATPAITRELLLKSLAPGRLATKRALGLIGTLPSWVPNDWFADETVKPIMAAPRFDRPMYDALRDHNPEWLIANLGDIKERDFVTLLFDNPRFIEAFLVGLSDEMGRELLWRGYPTDQRGTYFHRFWDEDDDLVEQIARFKTGTLGSHLSGSQPPPGSPPGTSPQARVVMLLRGEVIRRHPEALFVAVQRQGTGDDAIFSVPPSPGQTGSITFHAPLAADTMLVGFNLTEQQVKDDDWWFLLAEHPTAPRFGLDLPGGAPMTGKLNDLEWGDLPMSGRFLRAAPGPTAEGITWGSTAAATARMLLQNPARAAFGGKELLTGTTSA